MKIRYIAILAALIGHFFAFAMEKPTSATQVKEKSADLVILADSSTKEIPDVTADFFSDAIHANIPIIVSSHLPFLINEFDPALKEKNMREIQKLQEYMIKFRMSDISPKATKYQGAKKEFSDTSKWAIYSNPQKDWAVFLPQQYGKSLEELGLNSKELLLVTPDKINTEFSNTPNNIDIENLKRVFNGNSDIKKRIILAGHGTQEKPDRPAVMAALQSKQYQELLTFLNRFTDILFIISCYSGGVNLDTFNNLLTDTLKETFKIRDINFPIIVSSSTDAITTQFSEKALANFFPHINNFLKTGDKKELKEALSLFYNQDINNIPSIRFPGSNSFFRPIEFDNLYEIITATGLKKHNLQYMMQKKEIPPYEINNKRAILLYPAVITTPLKIIFDPKNSTIGSFDKPYPIFISRIGGPAQHILSKVEVPELSLKETIKMFLDLSKDSKAHLIKELVTSDGTYKNFALLASNGGLVGTAIMQSFHPQPFMMMGGGWINPGDWVLAYFDFDSLVRYKITAQEYLTYIQKILSKSVPSDMAIQNATGGQQNKELLDGAIKEFLNDIPIK